MLNDNARAFAARMNSLLKEDVVVCADELVIPRRYTSGFLGLDVILGGGWPGNQWVELIGKESAGKALWVDTPIPTPNGWTTMGKLQPGDTVFDETGHPCQVTFATPYQHDRSCYEVTFKDGSSLIADAEHQWTVLMKQDGGRIVERTLTTQDMFDIGLKRSDGRAWRFHIPTAEPVQYPVNDLDLPIDPYVLGVWLGDGSSNSGQITSADQFIIDELRGAGYRVDKLSGKYAWGTHGLFRQLRLNGLLNNKHVPEIYLRASLDDRLALIQGLMDTDGYTDHRGHCEFTTISEELADQVHELLVSTGHKVHRGEGKASLNGRWISNKYRLTFQSEYQVFRLPRKLQRITEATKSQFYMQRSLVAVTPVESVPVKCIQVDSPRSLYLAGKDMIPTHNTLVAFKTVAANQKRDPEFTTFWVAAEQYDSEQAEAMGVDNSRVVVASTQQMEVATQLLLEAVESKNFDCLVLDSYPALLPEEEEEKAMDEFTVGVGARMLNKFVRKAGRASRRKLDGSERPFIGIIINQFRDKVGGFAKFGCLHADTLVNFVDGRSIRIKDVVDKKMTGKVWSFNETSGLFEQREIRGWAFNGLVDAPDDYINIVSNGVGSRNGRFGITVTREHEVLTSDGWKQAQKINVGEFLTTREHQIINGTLAEFLSGALVGDSHIVNTSANAAALRFQDSNDPEYRDWKIQQLSRAFTFTQLNTSVGMRFTSAPSTELRWIKNQLGARNPLYFLDRFSKRGFAVWIMDDAHYNTKDSHRRYELSVKRLSMPEAEVVAARLSTMGYEVSHVRADRSIVFSVKGSEKIADDIAEFVPACMSRKLPEGHHGRYVHTALIFEEIVVSVPSEVVSVRTASKRQMRNRGKYDIAVEGVHNYLAGGTGNGVVVHNTPQTTPGGNGKNYFYYARLEVKRRDYVEEKRPGLDKPVRVGQVIQFETIKNKSAAPKQVTEAEVYFRGAPFKGFKRGDINVAREYVAMGKVLGVISGSSWLTFEGRKFHGEPGLATAMQEEPALKEAIAAAVLEAAQDPQLIDEVLNNE